MREKLEEVMKRLTHVMSEVNDFRTMVYETIEAGQEIVGGPTTTWPAPSVVNKLDFSLSVLDGLVETADRTEGILNIQSVNLRNAIDQYPEPEVED